MNAETKTVDPLAQPAPLATNGPAIWDLVIAEMRARDCVGRERYGTPLQADNGRDALADAFAEVLDLAVYLRQAMAEDWRGRALAAREALAYYANPVHYRRGGVDGFRLPSTIELDKGRRARIALGQEEQP